MLRPSTLLWRGRAVAGQRGATLIAGRGRTARSTFCSVGEQDTEGSGADEETEVVEGDKTKRAVKTVGKKKAPSRKDGLLPHLSYRKEALRVERNVVDAVKLDRVIGLDVSSQCTGYAVLDGRGMVLQCGTIANNRRDMESFERVQFMKGVFQHLKEKWSVADAPTGAVGLTSDATVWLAGVERALQSFGTFRYNQNTLMTLWALNALVSYECQIEFGNILKTHPTAVRAAFNVVKGKGTNSSLVKERVMEIVSEHLVPNMAWDTKQTVDESLRTSSFDVADAILTGVYATHEYRELNAAQREEGFAAFKEIFCKEYAEKIEATVQKETKRKRYTKPGLLRALDERVREVYLMYIRKTRPPMEELYVANPDVVEQIHFNP